MKKKKERDVKQKKKNWKEAEEEEEKEVLVAEEMPHPEVPFFCCFWTQLYFLHNFEIYQQNNNSSLS